jgi:hypothetical protein
MIMLEMLPGLLNNWRLVKQSQEYVKVVILVLLPDLALIIQELEVGLLLSTLALLSIVQWIPAQQMPLGHKLQQQAKQQMEFVILDIKVHPADLVLNQDPVVFGVQFLALVHKFYTAIQLFARTVEHALILLVDSLAVVLVLIMALIVNTILILALMGN